ncbi:unnamed protein product, partial [Scytosiphon promiscuus]
INVPGTPPHELLRKIGALAFFIRNINFDRELVNGRRGVIHSITNRRTGNIGVIADNHPMSFKMITSASTKCNKSGLEASPFIVSNSQFGYVVP